MSDKVHVAHVLIQPRTFERKMSAEDNAAVDDLVRQFHAKMAGLPLAVAAQAIGVLTSDYCRQISERGGESICALQDIAGRGEEWIRAGDMAQKVMADVRTNMVATRGRISRRPARRRKSEP